MHRRIGRRCEAIAPHRPKRAPHHHDRRLPASLRTAHTQTPRPPARLALVSEQNGRQKADARRLRSQGCQTTKAKTSARDSEPNVCFAISVIILLASVYQRQETGVHEGTDGGSPRILTKSKTSFNKYVFSPPEPHLILRLFFLVSLGGFSPFSPATSILRPPLRIIDSE